MDAAHPHPRDSLISAQHSDPVRPLSSTSSHSLGSLYQPTSNPTSLPSSSSHHALGLGHPSGPSTSSSTLAQAHAYPASRQEEPKRMFVRAKFDFEATDPSALSFSAGDVIEVYTQLESGWWDGMLGNVRGWFPSNFVAIIDPAEHGLHELNGSSQSHARTDSTESEHGQYGRNNAAGSVGGTHTDEIAPNGSGEYEEELGWGDVMGRQAWSGDDGGMDELAREVMRGAQDFGAGALERHVDTDPNTDTGGFGDFAAAAADRRRRQTQQGQAICTAADGSSTIGANGRGGNMQLGLDDLGADEFGVPRNRQLRGETERTLTLKPSPLPLHDGMVRGLGDNNPSEEDGENGNGSADNAWIPTLTPDGQVYYHNTITGEDSWHLPPTTPNSADRDSMYENDNEYFQTLTASSSQAFGHASSVHTPDTTEDTFRIPQHKRELPIGWVARMSDDGREWYYVNRITGKSQRHPPVDLEDSLERLTIDNQLPSLQNRPNTRHSVEVRRRAVEDWSNRTRLSLNKLLVPPKAQNMSWHIDMVQDSLRDVYEAAVAGSAAEEELSRAHDLGSQPGFAAAQLREEAAIQMLRESYRALLLTIRTLFSAFGYVGPMEGMVDMPRPKWVNEMGVIGSLTVLSASVHAALITRATSSNGTSNWSEVLRSAGKVKDVITGFPGWVTPGAPKSVRDAVEGKPTEITLNVQGAGMLLGGRWGFGTMDQSRQLRTFDREVVNDLDGLKRDFEAIDYAPERVLEVIRTVTKFKASTMGIDIAQIVDVDGDMSDRTKEEDGKAYEELVVRITNALLDLEESSAGIDELAVVLFQRPSAGYDTHRQLRDTINGSYTAIASLLDLSSQQKALASRAGIVHQIGHRSPHHVPISQAFSRPMSQVSNTSRNLRGSRRSIDRSRVQGLDEEFLDNNHDDLDIESLDRAGELVSASTNASQTSLLQQQQQQPKSARRGMGSQGDVSVVSATSSTTSLGFQQGESDGGSMRAKRSSLLKFMKGRSSQDDDSRGTFRNKGPSKKLAKLLGEDIQSFPSIPPPPVFSSAPPETPWYLGEDYPASDIIFDDKGAVRAGTLPALVARLTPHGSTDTSFFQAFLIMFRSFTTGPELLKLLIERYNLPEPEGMTPIETMGWKKLKQTPIRLRVSNVIRSWLDVHYLEAQDVEVLDDVEEFAATTLLQNGSELMSRQLITLVQRRRQGEGDTQRRVISGGLLSPPAPLVPRVAPGRSLKVTDIQPIELARQLTIMEFHHFQAIKINECLNKAWADDNKAVLAPNVGMVIKMANVIATWITSLILGQREVKARAGLVKYFTQTAMELRNLNNFSSMASIMAGLNSAPVLRLKRTRELVSQKTQAMKVELDKTLDSNKNFQNYKNMLKTINPPCVPFFGFWLSALTFIEDGNKNFLNPAQLPSSSSNNNLTSSAQSARTATTATTTYQTSDGNPPTGPLINFFKRALSAEILRDVQQYQSQPYNLARCKPVYEWITRQLDSWSQSNPDMAKLYDVSLALEPREKEEERVTRMLHDSGFI